MKMIEVIDCGSRKVAALVEILKTFNVTYHLIDLAGANDHVPFKNPLIITGGPHLFTNENSFATLVEKFTFLKKTDTSVLGICLGHQALGLINGAHVYRGPEVRSTEIISCSLDLHPLWKGLSKDEELVEDHCEGITLPDDFKLLAYSRSYAVEAMVHKTRPHFGVQFHPEASGEVGKKFLANYLRMAGFII